MASLDKLEGGTLEAAGYIAVGLIVLLVIVSYEAAHNATVPIGLYPETIWGNFASWVDGIFYNGPQSLKPLTDPLQAPIDSWLSGVYSWMDTNLPNPNASSAWQDYANQFQGPEQTVATGIGGS